MSSHSENCTAITLAAIVLTHDEETNLPPCLNSLSGLPCEVMIVDSGSTDKTLSIARAAGATVLEHRFESHAKQWRWAIEHRPSSAEWVLGIDADQQLTAELCKHIAQLISDPVRMRAFDGYYINRRHIFRGRWLRHGGVYPKYLLKLFRADSVRFDEHDLVDHHFYIVGPTSRLKGDLIEDNRKDHDIRFWISKHIDYASRHAREELMRRTYKPRRPVQSRLLGTPDERTAWSKEQWFRMPLYVRPVLYFFYRYFLLRGFLDGRQGFLFHFLQALWYRELIDAQLEELLHEQPCS